MQLPTTVTNSQSIPLTSSHIRAIDVFVTPVVRTLVGVSGTGTLTQFIVKLHIVRLRERIVNTNIRIVRIEKIISNSK